MEPLKDELIAVISKHLDVDQAGVQITIGDGNRLVADIPLVALEAVEEAGILGRAWDSIRLWIK